MPIEIIQAESPIVLALPYTGTNMHRSIVKRLNSDTQFMTAPDRHLDTLMGRVRDDLTEVRANFHRFLSDVDCLSPNQHLNPAKGMVGIVPLLGQDGKSIWNQPPGRREAASWRAMCYAPYHAALGAQIARARARFGHAVVINCRARALDAELKENKKSADITVSTYMGASCAVGFAADLVTILKSDSRFSAQLSGRVNTGWTTRHYGKPASAVQALDLEINEACYLTDDEHSGLYDSSTSGDLRALLGEALDHAIKWRPH